MKTSGTDIQTIDAYLHNNLLPEDRIIFEARLIISPLLRMQLMAQRSVYRLVALYHRKKLKAEIEQVHQTIFDSIHHHDLQQDIRKIFNH